MVKKGPCMHCGINSTPLWRNGPADKPVLCNACGSRFKLKGYIDDDYLPKSVQYLKNMKTGHAGAESNLTDDTDDDDDDSDEEEDDEDQLPNYVPPSGSGGTSNISSKGINSDFGKRNPSRKRTRVKYEKMTPMEEFHHQLLDLYQSEMGGIEPSPEDDLVDNVSNLIPSNEIGLGAILLKTDHDDVAPTNPPAGSLASSSIDNPVQCDQSSTTAPHH